MKFNKWLLGLAAVGAIAIAGGVKAQTVNILNPVPGSQIADTNAPTGPQSFFQSAASFFTSANTNYSWVSNRLEISAGGDYMSAQQWTDYLAGQYNFGRWYLVAKIRNLGVAGVIESGEVGGGYAFIEYFSVKLEGGILVGYDFERHAAIIEPGITVKDKLTTNTYTELGISEPVWLQKNLNRIPNISIGWGFTY